MPRVARAASPIVSSAILRWQTSISPAQSCHDENRQACKAAERSICAAEKTASHTGPRKARFGCRPKPEMEDT